MATIGGVNTVTSGLVLALDAASEKSFRGDPTTNLIITNPIPISTSGFSFAGPTSFTMSYNATEQAMEFEADNSAVWGFYISNNSLNLTPLDTSSLYSTSFEWKMGSRNTYNGSLRNEIIRGGGTSSSLSRVFSNNASSQTGSYAKFTHTFTPSHPGVDGDRQFRIIGSSFTSGSTRVHIFWKKLQLEKLDRSTPFVSGSRGATVSTGGGLIDLSRNNNNGELVNGPIYSSVNNGSIVFDGTNDYISILNPLSFQSQNISVSIWVYPQNAVTSLVTLIDYDHGSFSGWTIQSENATTNRNYYFAYHDGTTFQPAGNIGSGKGVQITNSIWNNIVYTKNGTSVIGYLNGVQTVNYTANNGNINYQPNKNFRIGDYISSSNRYYKGNISNTQIYNRALSSSEVLQNYNAQKSRFNL